MLEKHNRVGAPTKYTPDILKSLAEKLLIYVNSEKIPYLKHFCFINGFGSQNISEFAKSSIEFAEALNKFKDLFEYKLVKGAVDGYFNSYMVMNTLKNCCGWRDKLEIESTEHKTLHIEFETLQPGQLTAEANRVQAELAGIAGIRPTPN